MEVRYNQWSGAWDTLPELRRGGEERGGEGKRGEERGGEERRGEERGGEGRRGEGRGGEERGGGRGGEERANKQTRGGLHESHHGLTLTPNFHWASSHCMSGLSV